MYCQKINQKSFNQLFLHHLKNSSLNSEITREVSFSAKRITEKLAEEAKTELRLKREQQRLQLIETQAKNSKTVAKKSKTLVAKSIT